MFQTHSDGSAGNFFFILFSLKKREKFLVILKSKFLGILKDISNLILGKFKAFVWPK